MLIKGKSVKQVLNCILLITGLCLRKAQVGNSTWILHLWGVVAFMELTASFGRRFITYFHHLGELGGLLGLLLGGSIITFFEFIDVFLYNGAVKCSERRDRTQTRRQEDAERNYRIKQQHMEANGFGKNPAGWRSQNPHSSSGPYASHWA